MHWRRKWQPTPVFLSGESQARQTPPPRPGSQLLREQGQGSWGPAGSSPAKGDTDNSHHKGAEGPRDWCGCQLPQAPEAPSGWPGVPWACLGQPQVPARSKRGLFLGPLHLLATGRGPSLPGSALTVDEGLRLLIIRRHPVLLGGAGRLGGWDWGWGLIPGNFFFPKILIH